MNRSNSIFIIIICGFLLLIISGFIAAIIKLINAQAIIILLIISVLVYKSKYWKYIKLFIFKIFKLKYTNKKFKFQPRNRKIAAEKSIEGINFLITKIHSDVSAKALIEQKLRIENELLRGDIIAVVFGSGSTGKTSLVRALLNEIIGDVSAEFGSTAQSQTYRMRLKGLDRGIQIIDTPGIFESGPDGEKRKKDSLVRASRADLIIIVVDNDLRSIEMELISNLSMAGKRLIIALNKCDLRGEREVLDLISLIRNKTIKFISPEDIIEITSSPQTIPRPGYKPYKPKPEVTKLIKRIAKVLHEEGEELIADNILIQCRNLGLSGRRLLNKQRGISATKCVERYVWISSGVVIITPLPGMDLLGTAAVNGQMVMEISRIYGVKLTKERAKELALSVAKTLAGLGIVKSGVSLISNTLSLSLPTLVVGKFIQGISAAWLTKVAGESFITYFSQDQDWGDGGIQEVVQYHFNLNRRESNIRNFIETALKKVVNPISNNKNKQLPPHQKPHWEEEE